MSLFSTKLSMHRRILQNALAAVLCALACAWASPVPAQVFQPTTCRNSFTMQQEIAEGNKVVAEVYKQQPVLPDSDPVSQYVRSIGERLVSVAPLTPGMNQQWPFRFHVVASEEINAFALPGGTMFVNLGAIRAAETEAQLAGIMGHEMSHVILRHATCNLTRQNRKSIWYSLGEIGSSVLLGGTGGALAADAIGFGQKLDFLHMSRGDEQQADLLGVQIVHNAGYDPRGLAQFFEIIQAKYGSGGAQFLSDHPNPGNRTEYVDAEIARLPRLEHPLVTTPAFQRAHAEAMRDQVYTAKQMQSGQWRSSGLYASAPGAAAGTAGPGPVGAYTPVGQPPAGNEGGSIAPLPLGNLGLSTPARLIQAEGAEFAIPSAWQVQEQGVSATVAPQGGAGSFGLAYGLLVGEANAGGRVTDKNMLQQATSELARQIESKDGLSQAGSSQEISIRGGLALSTPMRGSSPVSENGRALTESDQLITIPRSDGNLEYLLLVCPERDRGRFGQVFGQVLSSLRVQ